MIKFDPHEYQEFAPQGTEDAARALLALIASLDTVRPVGVVAQSAEAAALARVLGVKWPARDEYDRLRREFGTEALS